MELRDEIAIEAMKIILSEAFKNIALCSKGEYEVFKDNIDNMGKNCYSISDNMLIAKKETLTPDNK